MCASGGSAALFLWLALYVAGVFGGNWTGLFFHGHRYPVPAELAAGTLHHSDHGYDGQFYRLAAHDPWLKRGFSQYMDAAQYRRQRILIPALAWFTGGGSDRWIDAAYIFWSGAFCGLGVWWLSRLCAMAGQPAWWGLAFLILPATVLSIHRMLLDAPLFALAFGVVYYDRIRADRALWAALAAACLCREVGVIFVIAVMLHKAAEREWRAVAVMATAIAPLAAWLWWLNAQMSSGNRGSFPEFLGLIPFQGYIARLQYWKPYELAQPILGIVHAADLISLLGLGLAIALSFLVWWRRKAQVAALIGAGFAGLCVLFSDPHGPWHDLYSSVRTMAPMLGMLDLMALTERRWMLFIPTLMQLPRLAFEFGRPLMTMMGNLTA